MSSVQIRDVRKSFGNFEVLHGVSIPIEDGEFVVAGRPLRLRQVDLAADARRPREHHLRNDLDRRPRRQQCPAERARHCDGVPELCALSAHDGRRQYGLLAQAARAPSAEEISARRQARRRNPGADAAARALSRGNCPAASASASPWAAPSCAIPRCSCSTSRCPTSTPSCASRCAPKSRNCTSG